MLHVFPGLCEMLPSFWYSLDSPPWREFLLFWAAVTRVPCYSDSTCYALCSRSDQMSAIWSPMSSSFLASLLSLAAREHDSSPMPWNDRLWLPSFLSRLMFLCYIERKRELSTIYSKPVHYNSILFIYPAPSGVGNGYLHSSILAWKIPWTEETGGLQSVGLQRVGHDWAGRHVLIGCFIYKYPFVGCFLIFLWFPLLCKIF